MDMYLPARSDSQVNSAPKQSMANNSPCQPRKQTDHRRKRPGTLRKALFIAAELADVPMTKQTMNGNAAATVSPGPGCAGVASRLGAFDNPHHPGGRIPCLPIFPPGAFQQRAVFRGSSFPPGSPAHHVDVEELGEMRHGGLGDEMFDDEHAAALCSGDVDRPQYLYAFLVIPVMQNQLHQIGIGGWNLLEHVAGNILAARAEAKFFRPQPGPVGDHLG